MKPEEIYLTDWKRLLFGDAPAWFLLEIFVRTVAIYLALIAIMRVFGKRMAGQLTILEMCVMLTLGAIVSAPMQLPERGVIVGVLLLVCVLLFQRGLGRLGFERRRAELVLQGDLVPLVKDGVLLTDQLRRASLSREQLYAALREQGVKQLGELRRVYLEACGQYSLFVRDEPKPGLCILPAHDHAVRASRCLLEGDLVACTGCGRCEGGDDGAPCPNCGDLRRAPAAI